ncbi:hypothetical protein ACRALDRAFT_2028107 [Sodiomyces alcalophilus JCM 7366]|uniref:uncharacterized protein n=1 Tax=Sodiomyces alcalophilus JCM 7366 TaxID=591952 RepID=UPI0039B4617D
MTIQQTQRRGVTPSDNRSEASSTSAAGPSSSYRRASRKGAPRKFSCTYAGCYKVYSRAEHLQRHQLNHAPKEIFKCDISGCEQKFVRADLLARHKKRHSPNYVPRNRAPSFATTHIQQGSSSASPENASAASITSSHLYLRPPATAPPSTTNASHPTLPAPATAAGSSLSRYSQSQPPHRPTHYQSHAATTTAPRTAGPHDAAILLTTDSNTDPTPTTTLHTPQLSRTHGPPRMPQPPPSHAWPSQPVMGDLAADMMRPKPSYYPSDPPAPPMPDPPSMLPFNHVGFTPDGQLSENFAVWLFDAQAGYNDFNSVASVPFLEGGLESTFNNNIHYDYESLGSHSQQEPISPHHFDVSDELISDHRRQEILRWFRIFRAKQPQYEPAIANMARESGGDLPGLSLDMLHRCLHEFWSAVSPRLPIVHRPSFSCGRCPIFLLMVMMALGGASLRARDSTGMLAEYGGFADVVIASIRWEIVTAEDASPPVALWVAQALVLVEFYEKLYSSRKFHERAHIYHTATLTLLRRGSPLIGRTGSESPPEEQVAQASEGAAGGGGGDDGAPGSRTWWVRWAETESMQRVVFAAFMLDITHAAMFDHLADMSPDEIRLPLPCDDGLWTASNPENFRAVDSTYRMYGIKRISFLEGLKTALHCNPVKTHAFGRMIIMSGLLSVGWHLNHRDSQVKWLGGTGHRNPAHDTWRKTLLRAFDVWKDSFDADIGIGDPGDGGGPSGSANGPIHSAAVLYHLAHISLHVNIIDCQVYTGAKRLVGRKVSTRDYANAVTRMKSWATTALTRHAVLHAFKLLHRVLVVGAGADPDSIRSRSNGGFGPALQPPQLEAYYSCHSESDPHRPWVLYYAVLTICSFVLALGGRAPRQSNGLGGDGGEGRAPSSREPYVRTVTYLSRVARLPELTVEMARTLGDGLPDLLQMLRESLEGTHFELLREARERLEVCRELLVEGHGSG